MPNQKISELTTATSPSVNDVLPIVNGGSTKKITAASLLSNSLSATTIALSGAVVRKSIEIVNPLPSPYYSDANVFLHAANAQIAIGDCDTGKTFRELGTYANNPTYANIFIGVKAGKGVSRGTYQGRPVHNVAIGTFAGFSLGGDDDPSCSGRTKTNEHNVLIGHSAGRELCADTSYSSSKNVMIGSRAFQGALSITTGSVGLGYGAGQYLTRSRHNTFIGYRAVNNFSLCFNSNYPKFNGVVGACAGCGLRCCSSNNVIIGYQANVNGFNNTNCVTSSIAIGNGANAFFSNSIAIGGFAYNCGDVVLGTGTRSSTTGNNTIVIGRNNNFNTRLSGSIVLGSCNCNISTSFVLGSPVFPLSARPDTTLAGQVSSLFVTINGENRRLAIFS
jgi:hypothetical protein